MWRAHPREKTIERGLALPPQVPPDLSNAIDFALVVPHTLDLAAQLFILLRDVEKRGNLDGLGAARAAHRELREFRGIDGGGECDSTSWAELGLL